MTQWRSGTERVVKFEVAVELLAGLVRVRGVGGMVVGETEVRRRGQVRSRARIRQVIESILLSMRQEDYIFGLNNLGRLSYFLCSPEAAASFLCLESASKFVSGFPAMTNFLVAGKGNL